MESLASSFEILEVESNDQSQRIFEIRDTSNSSETFVRTFLFWSKGQYVCGKNLYEFFKGKGYKILSDDVYLDKPLHKIAEYSLQEKELTDLGIPNDASLVILTEWKDEGGVDYFKMIHRRGGFRTNVVIKSVKDFCELHAFVFVCEVK